MTDRELLCQSLKHLSLYLNDSVPIVAALRARLAQYSALDEAIAAGDGTLHGAIDHWQAKAQRQWQGLTVEDVDQIYADYKGGFDFPQIAHVFAFEVENRVKEKNA